MMESFTIEQFTIVFSPMATLGPTMEYLISHPSAMLTGGIKIVFSNEFDSAMLPPNFFKRMAFDSSSDSFLPQSNQFCTLKDLNLAPLCIMHSRPSVRLNSLWLLMSLVIIFSRQLNRNEVSLILYNPTSAIFDFGIEGFSTTRLMNPSSSISATPKFLGSSTFFT